jgi:hypothetical protein
VRAYANLGTGHMHLNEYVKAVAFFEAQHVMATSLKLAHGQSVAALNMGVASPPSPFASAQLGRALLLVLTELLDRIVTRRRRRAWMIECGGGKVAPGCLGWWSSICKPAPGAPHL